MVETNDTAFETNDTAFETNDTAFDTNEESSNETEESEESSNTTEEWEESSNATVNSSDTAFETYNTAEETYDTSVETYNTAEETYDTSVETYDTAEETYDTSVETYNTAEESVETYNTAEETYDTSVETYNTAEETYDTSVETYDSAVESSDITTSELLSDTTEGSSDTTEQSAADSSEESSEYTSISSEDNDIETEITLEEAEKRSSITISFRQINQFENSDNTVRFNLYTLVSDSITQGTSVLLLVNLILNNGEREDITRNVNCTLTEDVSPSEGHSEQGSFRCSLSGLTEEYYSLRLNNSDSVSGIPEDEVLLDPMLTREAIASGKLIDYSIEENHSADKIPATFSVTNIKEDTCGSNGKFLIEGSLSKEIADDLSFNIPLTFPDGITTSCTLLNKTAGTSQISCQVDRNIDASNIVFEQMVIKDGALEVMNLEGFSSEETITCSNGLLTESEKKTNVQVSFRQVSHLELNGVNGFSFFFASFANQDLPTGTTLTMKITVLVGETKKEKEATCTLQNNVVVKNDRQVQGSFNCQVNVEESEYREIKFEDSEAVKISTDNENIAGVQDEDDNLSPLATDKAINDTKTKIAANETMTDLAECLDYSEEENINREPPSLEIVAINNLQQCTRGKFTVTGKFSTDITEETTFTLPLSYPQIDVKCKVTEATKDQEVEMTCKTLKKFKLVNSFVIEPKKKKKKYKELLFIKKNVIEFTDKIACENYNELKYQWTKQKQKADFSFLQLSQFRPVGRRARFFFGITRVNRAVPFTNLNITIISRFQAKLRQLQGNGVSLEELPTTCTIDSQSDTACGLNCQSDEGTNTPTGIEITEDTPIAGLPDTPDPSVLPVSIDYSNPDNLNIIDNLPSVSIIGIDGSGCEETGEYTIGGKVSSGNLKNKTNVEIPFSNPDSTGLCDINVDGENVEMVCHNKEKFSASSILFGQTIIKDSDGEELFILNSYTNQKSFACGISVLSSFVQPNNSTITPSGDPNNDSDNNNNDDDEETQIAKRLYRKSSSGGLSGGAIAGIIIAIVAVIAITAGVALYLKKNTKPPVEESYNNSTIDKITKVPNPNYL